MAAQRSDLGAKGKKDEEESSSVALVGSGATPFEEEEEERSAYPLTSSQHPHRRRRIPTTKLSGDKACASTQASCSPALSIADNLQASLHQPPPRSTLSIFRSSSDVVESPAWFLSTLAVTHQRDSDRESQTDRPDAALEGEILSFNHSNREARVVLINCVTGTFKLLPALHSWDHPAFEEHENVADIYMVANVDQASHEYYLLLATPHHRRSYKVAFTTSWLNYSLQVYDSWRGQWKSSSLGRA